MIRRSSFRKWLLESCSLLFLLSSYFLLIGVFLFDVLELLQIFLSHREGLGRQFLALEVEIPQSLLVAILFSTFKYDLSQLFGTFFAFCVHLLQNRNISIKNILHFLQSYPFFLDIFLMCFDMLLIVRVTLCLENLLMSHKSFNNWS